MSHAVFSIVTEVTRGQEGPLRRLLHQIERDHSGNGLIDFTSFAGLHFSSLTLFPPYEDVADQPWLLVFEHNVDGGWRSHLAQLVEQPGIRIIYSLCAHCPADDSAGSIYRYLSGHVKHPNLYHVGTPYRRVDTIRSDLRLRDALEQQADVLARSPDPGTASTVWAQLRDALRGGAPTGGVTFPSAGTRLPIPLPEPRTLSRLYRWGTALLVALAAWSILAWGIAVLWFSPARLSAALVVLFLIHGMWTGVLLGWPVFARDRERPPGETRGQTRRALLGGWRNTLNIWAWFVGVGWSVSLVPASFRLAGIHATLFMPWLAAIPLATLTIGVLVFLVGVWSLPTPELARPRPDRADLEPVLEQEDVRVINHMSAMVRLRPGRLRRVALRVLLWSLNTTWFHTWLRDVGKGRLFEFSTVHFAQWVVLDQDRYMFLSNYDHSFTRYLDDFGKISFGLARLWGMGARTPGLANLERFKDFARTWMTPYSVWYAAYPGTSVTQVWNNEALRRGLAASPAVTDPDEMLQRLVNAKDR